MHWEVLYGEVSLERHLGLKSERISRSRRARYELDVRLVRATLCTQLEIPEEAMLTERISVFYQEHEPFALLPLQYPAARVLKDTMASDVVDSFRKTFGEVSDEMHTAHDALKAASGRVYDRTKRVAEQEHLVVWPKATAEACCVAAFAVLKCKQLFQQHCWTGSMLQPVQQTFGDKYPPKDCHFWAMYGCWSVCQHCGSVHFNDAYFKEAVYKDLGVSLSQMDRCPLIR